jgi:ABC-2 type transport system permease protein
MGLEFHGARAIAWQEIVFLARHRILRVLIGLLAAMLLLALIASWQHHASTLRQQDRLQVLVSQQWLEQPDRHPHRAAHYGSFAFRQPSPLAFIDRGVESYAGNAVYLEAHRQNPPNFAAARHATMLLRFGELTPAFLLQAIVPLLILVLAGASIAREREQRTGLLLQAQGVGTPTLVIGKALAYFGLGAAAVLMVAGVSLAALLASGQRLDLDGATRLILLVLAYLVLMAVCALGAAWASLLSRNTRQALLVLVGIWVLAFVVMPRVLPYWSQVAYPVPTRLAFEAAVHAELKRSGDGHNANDPDFSQFRKNVLANYGVERKEDLPVNIRGLVMAESERRASVVYERLYAKLQAQLERQDSFERWLSLSNPMLAAKQLSAALSGTDRAAFSDFERQAESYRYGMIEHLNHLHAHEIREENDGDQRVSSAHWRDFPPFKQSPRALSALGGTLLVPFLALLAWLAAAVAVVLARSGGDVE